MNDETEIGQNPLIYQRWLFLADKIQANPGLLSVAVENISRWKKSDRLGNLWALEIWEGLVGGAIKSSQGLEKLLGVIRVDDEDTRQLKSCSPFPGILTTEELDQFACASVL